MMSSSWIVSFLRVGVVVTAIYMGMLTLYVGAMLGFAAIESRRRRRQRDVEDDGALLESRFTIPVSVIAPAFNERIMAVHATRSLLDLTYAQHEVIVVDDGSNDGTLDALIAAFDLEPRPMTFRNVLSTKPVRMVYRSRLDPRLLVVSKENGGKADALNCGINFARYRYLCCVDGDTLYSRDALLRAMSHVVKDPARIVAAASLFGVSAEPEAGVANGGAPRTSGHLLADFQHLDLMRSFVAYRLAWSRLDCMMCVPGGFGVWRRDVVLELGGFSPNFTCEDIEMTFRIHERFRREGRPYRILSLPSMVAQTEGPTSVRSLISQRARWQRVTLETIWHYRRMLWRPRYGAVGALAFPYYLFFECLAPAFQLLSFATLGAAIVAGILNWPSYLALLGIITFGAAIPTTIAVLLHDSGFRDYRIRDLLRMIALGPLDVVFYRPVLAYAGLRGCWEFLRKDKSWNKFERNVRRAAAAALVFAFGAGAKRAHAQSRDSVERVRVTAQSALWSGHAARAISLTDDALSVDPRNVDLLVLQASALRQLNELPQALEVIERAYAISPTRTDVADLRRRLRHETGGAEIALGNAYEHASADDRNETQLALRKNTQYGAAVARVSHVSRLGLSDDQVQLEVAPRFHAGYVALGATHSSNATLYPNTSASAEVFGVFPGAVEGSLGFRRLSFASPVNVSTASLSTYRGDFRIGARANHVSGGSEGNVFGLSVRRYLNDGEQYIGALGSIGSVREDIRTQIDANTRATRAIGAEAFFLFRSRWTLNAQTGVSREEPRGSASVLRTSASLGLGLRF